MNKQVLIGLSTLSLVTILSGVALSSSNSFAASASTATATVKIATSCTLTTTGGGNYSATVPNGTSAEIEGSTLTASCNDAGGFALYAVGYSNDTIGNNNMIGQSTNIATNTSGNNSYWAMKINPTTGNTPTIENSFNDFHIIPNAHTKVASYSGSTGTGSLSVDATYKASISSTQLAGNYLGKVKYTLIHPSSGDAPVAPLSPSDCPAHSICYAPNADDIEGTMLDVKFSTVAASPKAGRQTETTIGNNEVNITANSIADLRAYNYSRPGYGFAGWSPSYEASTTSGSTDIIFGPQATISTYPNDLGGVDVDTNGLILYPVWVASTGSMQTFSSSDCNAMSIGDVTARTDNRDGNTYTIAKLPDGNTGKCWMVENLRLSNDANITTSNTQSNNGVWGGVFTGLAKPENSFVNQVTPNSLYSTDGTAINVISDGNSAFWAYRIPRYNDDNINRSLTVSYDKNGADPRYQWYGYGNYYNWPAAIADTTHYSVNDQSVSSTSLCPAGWRLPRGGDKNNEVNNDFWALVIDGLNNGTEPVHYGFFTDEDDEETILLEKALRSYPNNFIYAGESYNRANTNRHVVGYYWSSTSHDYYTSYTFYLGSDVSIGVSSARYKNNGTSIRCLSNS